MSEDAAVQEMVLNGLLLDEAVARVEVMVSDIRAGVGPIPNEAEFLVLYRHQLMDSVQDPMVLAGIVAHAIHRLATIKMEAEANGR